MNWPCITSNTSRLNLIENDHITYLLCRERSGTLSDLSRTLNDLNEEIYKIKQDIDEQGTQKMSGGKLNTDETMIIMQL